MCLIKIYNYIYNYLTKCILKRRQQKIQVNKDKKYYFNVNMKGAK